MKIKPYDIDRFLTKMPADLRALVIFGSDEGRIRLTSQKAQRVFLKDGSDPFNLRNLSLEQIRSDPARLAQEASNLSLGGGRIIVRITQANDYATKALGALLELEKNSGIAIIEAGALSPRSSLRALAEKDKAIAALACYPDRPQELADLVRTRLRQAKFHIAPDVLNFFVQRLGIDRAITENEIEKLILYMGEKKQIDKDDIKKATGDMAAFALDDLSDYVGLGEIAHFTRVFDRLTLSGMTLPTLLTITQNHFQKLKIVKTTIDNGLSISVAVQNQKPPIHFTRQKRFIKQLHIWDMINLNKALLFLWQKQIEVRKQSYISSALGADSLLSLARQARRLAKNQHN